MNRMQRRAALKNIRPGEENKNVRVYIEVESRKIVIELRGTTSNVAMSCALDDDTAIRLANSIKQAAWINWRLKFRQRLKAFFRR